MPLDQTDPLWHAIMRVLEAFNQDRASGLITDALLRATDELRVELWRDQRKAHNVALAAASLPGRSVSDGDSRPA